MNIKTTTIKTELKSSQKYQNKDNTVIKIVLY